MHKVSYASGFLYHSDSQQILLQQSQNKSPLWSLFYGIQQDVQNGTATFQQIIKDFLQIKIESTAISPVYSYSREKDTITHSVYYAEIGSLNQRFTPKTGFEIAWFPFKKLYKLALTQQTRQDITVGIRVIQAGARDKETVSPSIIQ